MQYFLLCRLDNKFSLMETHDWDKLINTYKTKYETKVVEISRELFSALKDHTYTNRGQAYLKELWSNAH